MAEPLGLCLLTLMALAPVLPWRKASGELLRHRLLWPAWCGTGALVLAVVLGGGGFAPLVAFFLAGFAAGSALRQLVIATRRQGIHGLIGRANGGMIVHLGVIMIAVAIAAMGSYARFAIVTLQPGETRHVLGHDVTYERPDEVDQGAKFSSKALVRLDGGKTLAPAVQRFQDGTLVNVPSVQTHWNGDVYLTLEVSATAANPAATIGVRTFPLAAWLWTGGGIMAIGTVLSAFPGKRRRRPTDAVSAPIRVEEEPALAAV
jgi:cytochrome c-type biogenesis protein CcmF